VTVFHSQINVCEMRTILLINHAVSKFTIIGRVNYD